MHVLVVVPVEDLLSAVACRLIQNLEVGGVCLATKVLGEFLNLYAMVVIELVQQDAAKKSRLVFFAFSFTLDVC